MTVGGLPPPGQLDLVVAVPVGCRIADDLPPGVHFNVDGSVATVVFEGTEPDPAVMAALNERLPPWGLAITAHPDPDRPPTRRQPSLTAGRGTTIPP